MSENMKNVLLVMSNGGFLAPPDEKPEQEELWNETWKRINRFLPSFFAELFPDEAQKPKAATRTSKDGKEAPEKETGQEAATAEETTETKEATVEG